MSSRHNGGQYPTVIANSHFVLKQCLANALASSPQSDSSRKGFKILCQALPPMCLPLSTRYNHNLTDKANGKCESGILMPIVVTQGVGYIIIE